jgi:5-methylcytosine-specific restriction endonuclease McrA
VIGLSKFKKTSKVKYYSPKRRAVYAKGDDITALVLFEMHAWTCGICLKPINKYLRLPNYMAATIEHRLPISKGGTHTWDNVIPAHARCNFQKGDIASEPILLYT